MNFALKVTNLSFKMGQFVEGPITINIEDGEYFILMGKTGSGKSLFLKAICGFVKTESNTIFLHDHDISKEPISRRGIGYVPQGSFLFPHMTVIDNILFPLTNRNISRRESNAKIAELIELLEIKHLLNRQPQSLSGGERQKVALARALAFKPKLLILDEPVSALDEPSRREICNVLKDIHNYYNITTIHVCHSTEECRTMADRVGIMDQGTIVQAGRFDELLNEPINDSVKQLVRVCL